MASPNSAGAAPTCPMASLYVGGLHSDVTEAILFEKFSSAGPIMSIRVCRDMITRKSLGYAYVNFQQPKDAERALETMNCDVLRGRSLRIMWAQRDPELRRSGRWNICVKNLDLTIDNKLLYDTFSAFGNILSCKVITDDNNQSKGFAFVQFETEESADNAVSKVNGMLLAGKKVVVGRLISGTRKCTNVFIKGFDDQLDEQKLRELLSRYGTVTSCKVVTDDNGQSKGSGFASFENPEEAETAVQNLNGYTVGDKQLFVGRFQKKNERLSEMKREKRITKDQGLNLYIKNLDSSIDDERLRGEFAKFGSITSAKVMQENGHSKGFGFVCYSSPDEATKAVVEMNGTIVGGKPLYVTLAQRREERRMPLTNASIVAPALADEHPQERNESIRDRLVPMIQQIQAELVGKVTDMILELDHAELLQLLDSSEALKSKVEEAMALLLIDRAQPLKTTTAP